MPSIKSFPHDVQSYHHWKFQALRKTYGWAGEGKFWALNCIIATAEGCMLDLTEPEVRNMLVTELGFGNEKELLWFITFLISDECRLLKEKKKLLIVTDVTTETLKAAVKKAKRNAKDYMKRRSKTPDKPKPNRKRRTPEDLPPEILEKFDAFWKLYPIKEAKKESCMKYSNLIERKPELHQTIIAAVMAQNENFEKRKAAKLWTKRWKNPTTWLNGECWNDEIITENHATNQKHHQGKVSQTGTADIEVH